MQYKYAQAPTDKEWKKAPVFNAYQIAFAVDIATGDTGYQAQKVMDILIHERQEALKNAKERN